MVAITDTEGECIPIMIVTFARTLPLIMLGACLSLSNMRRGLERQWAEDVLLGAESGPDRDGVVRWGHPVTFLVVDAEARFRTAIDRAFVQLEQALDGVHAVQLEYVGSQDRRVGVEGYVTVFAKAPAEAAGLAADLGVVSPAVDADGWFTITWNDAYELTRGLVFINPDLEQRWLRHTARRVDRPSSRDDDAVARASGAARVAEGAAASAMALPAKVLDRERLQRHVSHRLLFRAANTLGAFATAAHAMPQ